MTERDYLLSNLTKMDKVRGNSIWLPPIIVVLMIVGELFEIPFVPVQRLLLIAFIITFAIAVVSRTKLSNKISDLKNEYQKKYSQ